MIFFYWFLKRFLDWFWQILIDHFAWNIHRRMWFLIVLVVLMWSVYLHIHFLNCEFSLLIIYHWFINDLVRLKLIVNTFSIHLKIHFTWHYSFLFIFIKIVHYWYTGLTLVGITEVEYMYLPKSNSVISLCVEFELRLDHLRYLVNFSYFRHCLVNWINGR